MSKTVFLTEKPSQAMDYIKALKLHGTRKDGFFESENTIVTWCVGHLVSMSYPEKYDSALKKWRLDTLPFIPEKYKYEVIDSVKKQFYIVKNILTSPDVNTIYFAGDSGREGQYIEELVIMMCGSKIQKKKMLRIWIDSTTEDEILRGIKNAKDMSYYKNLGQAGFLRAKEDYLMGINFSRLITLKYAMHVKKQLKMDKLSISVGRVMSCVLGMVVRREEEIKRFHSTPFYRVLGKMDGEHMELEWRAVDKSRYHNSPLLYKKNGFLEKKDAESFCASLPKNGVVEKAEKKEEKRYAPLLYNLAELQNECSKTLKISPDETLNIVQTLYEKKMVTYPRTDARVLSTAIAEVIENNIWGVSQISEFSVIANEALKNVHNISSRYVDDSKITDHYAIIPTGQGLDAQIDGVQAAVYRMVVRRFLAIFLPPAKYSKMSVEINVGGERFFWSDKILLSSGFLSLYQTEEPNKKLNIPELSKGQEVTFTEFQIKEGNTKPPSRYTSGSIILAMENAGQLIEDENLREQIKGSGIGTSATRAEILKKLVKINYINLAKKTQLLSPTKLGYAVYIVLAQNIPQVLNPKLTANWEMGLSQVEEGKITEDEYLEKLYTFIIKITEQVKQIDNTREIIEYINYFCQ